MVAEDEDDAFFLVQELLSYLPDHNDAEPPHHPTEDPIDRMNDELEAMVPDNPNRPYDMVGVVKEVVDDGNFLSCFQTTLRTSSSVPASTDEVLAWSAINRMSLLFLDIGASIKAARFIRLCDAFNIPLVTFEDVQASYPELFRSGEESYGMVQNCCLHMRKPPYQN